MGSTGVGVSLQREVNGGWERGGRLSAPSERVAIAAAVAADMPERRGGDHQSESNVGKRPQWQGKRTREIASKRAGFGWAGQGPRQEEERFR